LQGKRKHDFDKSELKPQSAFLDWHLQAIKLLHTRPVNRERAARRKILEARLS